MADTPSKTTKKSAAAPSPAKPAAKKTVAKTSAAPAAEKKPAVKKATAPKAVAPKAPAKKAAAAKTPAAQKTAAKKSTITRGVMEVDAPKLMLVTDEQRYRMIAEAAYYRAESNHFRSDPVRDWIEAEKDITALLSGGSR